MPRSILPQRRDERGSIFFYILLGVALFGALAFTMSRNMRSQNTSAMSEKQAEIVALDIMAYAQEVERTVDRLRRRGCSENEISFEKAPFDGTDAAYVNSRSPSDFSCHVFHPRGGKLTYADPLPNVNDGTRWLYTWANIVPGIGKTNISGVGKFKSVDMLAILPYVSLNICNAINKQVGIDAPPPQDGGNYDYYEFIGVYQGGSAILDSGNRLEGKPTACFEADGIFGKSQNGGYHFYHVLLAR